MREWVKHFAVYWGPNRSLREEMFGDDRKRLARPLCGRRKPAVEGGMCFLFCERAWSVWLEVSTGRLKSSGKSWNGCWLTC